MADLIININLDESRKKQNLVIETYEGTIPNLKSKKYSGQLRNVNLSSVSHADNLSSTELQIVKKIFNDPVNTQISSYQYIFSVSHLPYLQSVVKYGCVFCKNTRKSPMYNIEQLYLNVAHENSVCIRDFSVYQDKTFLYIDYDVEKKDEITRSITPLFYINIYSDPYSAELFFDYGNDFVKANDKDLFLTSSAVYRDYKFEQDILACIKKSNWKTSGKGSFIYIGNEIAYDMLSLEQSGVMLYTNSRKRINIGNFSNVSISYGIDWFDLKGDIKAGDNKFDLSKLVDFSKAKEDWIEYNGQVVFAPPGLKELGKNRFKKSGDSLKLSTNDILSAMEVIDYFGSNAALDFRELTSYQDICLRLPSVLDSVLRNYQRVGIKWLLSLRKNGFGGCLADDMGLGKTLQVISYLSDKSQENTKALIVVPKTLIVNWIREFQKFAPDVSTYVYHGPERSLEEAHKFRAVITTYGTLLNDIGLLRSCFFDHLIVDEAQNIKNSRSKAHSAVRQVHARTKIIMTGTPLENNIQEYWGLMRIANPTKRSYKDISKGLSGEQILDKIKRLTNPFLLRRFKKDVLDDLPEKEEQIIYCSFDESQRTLYDSLLNSIRHEINRIPDRFEIKSNAIVLSGLMYLQEVCCHPRLIPREYNINQCNESAKTEQLIVMINELYASDHKIIVFSRFIRMLEIINKELVKYHLNVFYLDGTTSNRQKVVDDFENSTDGVFLISLKAGGVGLNLVSADTAIIYDPWWNPAVEKQAEDRIYRIGQKKKVTIYKLIAANTIEEKVIDLQETKKKLFDEVIDGHEIPMDITMEDIRNLLS